MKDLEGKLALVTGGAKGVGKVIARQLAARGAHVIINFFHSSDAAKQTQTELAALGAQVSCMRASVAQPQQVERMFAEIEATYGYLDILVNNAASGAFVPVGQITPDDFERALNTNLKGSFWCARHAAPLMARRGGGCIVNVSSIGAGLVPANYLVVGTSKAALESLTRYLAAEYAGWNIRVNTASATMIEGDVARQFPRYAEMKQVSIDATPLGRLAEPEDLSGVVMFLTSEQSRWVTGQTILADGGLSLGSTVLAPPHSFMGNAGAPAPATAQVGTVPLAAMPDHLDGAASGSAATASTSVAAALPEAALPAQARHADGADTSEDIAVVGMGLIVPGADTPEAYWRVLLEGAELFVDVPPERWDSRHFYAADAGQADKTYQGKSAFITDSLPDQASGSGAANEVTTYWLRHALRQALTGVAAEPTDRYTCVIGYTPDGSQHLEEAMVLAGTRERLAEQMALLDAPQAEKLTTLAAIDSALQERYWRGSVDPAQFLPHNVGRNAIADILPASTDLLIVDTACSSSLYAIDIAIKQLLVGQHDVAVCGGAFALAPRGSVLFAKLHGLSVSGNVRPLDKDCDGVLFADGAGIVVLKRLRRAQADGDQILGVIKAVGTSSDGKGKAIYAPSAPGQCLAVERALAHPAVDRRQINWVVAHATGTPAGDTTEFASLRETIQSDQPVYITSNKSLIGHTGWAAGVVSLIQVLLGFQHGRIPPQHNFSAPPAEFAIEQTNLVIPTSLVEWPSQSATPRLASISGFGFGGTNAHLIVADRESDAAPSQAPARAYAERIAVIGWSTHLPGLTSPAAVEDWLLDRGQAPAQSFGEQYPLPPFEQVRLPPALIRTIDRCQLMILKCAHDLRAQLGAFWEERRELTGVFLGHMGATRTATLYASRCYLDEIRHVLRAEPALVDSGLLGPLLDGLTEHVQRLVPATNENSFPGMMPNVIPARVANYFDLKGPTMTIDMGVASTFAAIEVACSYLRSCDVDLALVGGINGNTTPEMQALFADLSGATLPLAEGAIVFALARETTAIEAGLPVLGFIDVPAQDAAVPPTTPTLECGMAQDGAGRPHYLGAEGALALLQMLLRPQPQVLLQCHHHVDPSVRRLLLGAPDQELIASPTNVPAQFTDALQYAPGEPLALQRQVVVLEPFPRQVVRPALPFLAPGTLILTDQPALLAALEPLPADVLVISVAPLDSPAANRLYLPLVTPDAVKQIVADLTVAPVHLRVLTNLSHAADPAQSLWAESTGLVSLHDLVFLVVQQLFDRLSQGDSSLIALLLGAVPAGSLHPFAGLFNGLIKSCALELPRCVIVAVCSSSESLELGLQQATQESAARQLLPVVVYDGDVRQTFYLNEIAGELTATSQARIDRSSVIVAVGGARGITAEVLKAVAQHFQPQIYLLGSNPLADYSPDVFRGDDAEFAQQRQSYIRTQKTARPELAIGQINKAFDRLIDARAAQHNLNILRSACGAARVHYITCDVLNRAQVAQVMADIQQTAGRIDLLINAAGINRSASIPVKSFADFQAVRDIKLRGYQNLKYALRDCPPRMWCNFGSFIGLTGQLGETDYAAGNDFLATAASYAVGTLGQDELTMGWTLWHSVGLGANPLTQSFLQKSGLFTSMSTAEGVHHFIRELNLPQHEPSTIYIGAPEKQAIVTHIPEFFTARAQARPAASRRAPFYLGHMLRRTADQLVAERTFDIQTDSYLQHHRVNNYPTLPGLFVPEIAAEAAVSLLPDLHVIGFADIDLQAFLRLYDRGTPQVKRIRARIVNHTAERSVVQVHILTDVVAPSGQILLRDKLHFAIKVVLSQHWPATPYWEHWDDYGEKPMLDPYHLPTSPVLLTDMFVSTTDTRLHPLGKRARYQVSLAPDDPIFASFMVPSILMDGLARTAVLNVEAGDYVPVAAPSTIRRIDLYEAVNDCELARQAQPIQLYATPYDIDIERADRANRFVAVRPDGRVLLQMKDITGVILGYIRRSTGEFVPREALAEVRARQDTVSIAAR